MGTTRPANVVCVVESTRKEGGCGTVFRSTSTVGIQSFNRFGSKIDFASSIFPSVIFPFKISFHSPPLLPYSHHPPALSLSLLRTPTSLLPPRHAFIKPSPLLPSLFMPSPFLPLHLLLERLSVHAFPLCFSSVSLFMPS